MESSVITAPKTTDVPLARASRWLWWLAPAGAAAVVSARLAPSYDEVYWLAVIRKLADGGRLYDTVIDNKGPLWYPIFTLFDWAPTPFWLTRALTIAVVVLGLCWAANRFMRDAGIARSVRHFSAAAVSIAMVTLSSFHLTIELFGALLVILALVVVRRTVVGAAAVLFLSLLIDPRIALLLPAVLTVELRHPKGGHSTRSPWRAILTIGVPSTIAMALYLLVPDMRFAVLEVGRATRIGEPFSFRATSIAALSSVVILVAIFCVQARYAGVRIGRSALLMATGATLIALASLAPFTHYWTYLPLAAVLVEQRPNNIIRRHVWWIILLTASLAPALMFSLNDAWDNRLVDTAFSHADSLLLRVLSPRDRIVVFAADPHPYARFPSQTLGRAPNAFYLGMDTSRQEEFLAEFAHDLDRADMIWVETLGQDIDRIKPKSALSQAWAVLMSHVDEYACRADVYPVLVVAREVSVCLALTHPPTTE
jgi:hypothetical protein